MDHTQGRRRAARPRERGARIYTLLGALGLAAALLLSACSGTSTPQSQALLKAAQDKFNAAKSFHFIMQADNLGTAPQDVLNVKNAEGDVQRPDKLSATGFVTVNGLSVNTKIVIVGGRAWYELPILGFQEDDEYADFIQIFDAKNGVGNLLTQLKNPGAPQDSTVNNVACWKITGDVDAQLVSTLLGGQASANAAPKVSVCIGKSDSRLYSATIVGPVIQGDKTNTTRTFYLSKYDQPVNIQPPTA
jgi:hypothetical protein